LSQSQTVNGSTALPSNGAISNQALTSSLNNQPLNGNPNPAIGTRQQFTALIPPEQQSAQLKELVQRLAQTKQQTPEQSAQAFNEIRRLNAADQQAYADKTKAAPGAPGTTPPGVAGGQTPAVTPPQDALNGGGPTPGAAKPDESAPSQLNPMLSGPITGANEKPFVITSLAAGIKAKGLADLLTTAENQMRQGKFSSALDTYDQARQVAPNNPFAVLGRAFAELGEASYGRAETDLRRSFMAESGAVLLGQYDLRGFLGEDRLKFVVKDLKEINGKEKNERSAFLLAYIAHNVGDDESAANLLDEADQRAGGNDPVIQLMRQNWQLKNPGAK
jgi:tetratricopeptide (TPR) repeat protein